MSLPQQHDDIMLCLHVYDLPVRSVSAALALGASHCLQVAYHVLVNMHKAVSCCDKETVQGL